MKWLKRLIARLFNIQPDDLPTEKPKTSETPLGQEVKAEISREVGKQLDSYLQEIIMPVVEKWMDAKLRVMVETALKPQASVLEEASEAGTRPRDLNREEVIPEDEFPLIEDTLPEKIGEQGLESADLQTYLLPESPVISEPYGTYEAESPHPVQQTFPQEEVLPLLEEAKPEEPPEAIEPGLESIEGKTLRLGIDFGTTTTAVSLKVGDELPEALPIGADGVKRYLPSVVYFAPGEGDLDKRVIVGEEAESFGDNPFVIRSIKRCLGCDGNSCAEDGVLESPFPWCRGNGQINISENEAIAPERIAYFIVREAIQRAITVVRERWQLDLTLENVTFLPLNLGCSARFDFSQREIIRKVSSELGFLHVRIENVVEEPILAGFTFSRFAENPYGRALIYDFGGGTFDVAILEVDRTAVGNRVTVLSTAGDSWLGGDDIDTLIYHYFLEQAGHEYNLPANEIEENLEPIERNRLRNIARQAKEQLSDLQQYSQVLLSEKYGPINLELSRPEFEHLLEKSGLLKNSLEAVKQACQLAYAFENARHGQLLDYPTILKHDLKDACELLDKVILVGGVTKIPYLRRKLEGTFPGKIVSETVIEPLSAVAIGGTYPHEPQHYSLSSPPYGFFLEAEAAENGAKIRIPVFEPYEYMDFHERWSSNACPAHIKRINLPTDLIKAKLYFKLADHAEVQVQKDLGRMRAGMWLFGITLDGEMFCRMVNENPISLKTYPIIHPIQREISKAKYEKYKAQHQVAGTYEDWTRDMMSEN